MPDREMVIMVSMNKEEVVKVMIDSINEDNKELCLKSGMSEEDAQSQVDQSQPSLQFIIGNVYDRLVATGII